MLKQARYLFEGVMLALLFTLFGRLSPDHASAVGGWIGRTLGPRMAVSRKARKNIAASLPELDERAQRAILTGMWDNLGRVIAEYPHLRWLAQHRTAVDDIALFHRLRDDGQPGLIIGAHMANWEIAGPAALVQAGFPLDLIYRAPNNPYVDKLLKRIRTGLPELRSMPKSKTGTRHLIQSLKEGRHVGILVDQKYNEGIPALFFGRPAMTSPAYVHFAQKFNCPLVLTRIERTGGANFRISAIDLPYNDAGGNPLPAEAVIDATHAWLERWIRERPGQWLWLHRRWSERAEREYLHTK